MSLPELLLLWIVVIGLVVGTGRLQGIKLCAGLFGKAILTATALTGLAALYPLTQSLGFFGVIISWLRRILSFAIVVASITKYSPRKALTMGFTFAFYYTLTDALC